MEDLNTNQINVDDDEEEEEINTTHCPYKKVTNFLGSFFGGKSQTNPEQKNNNENSNPKLSTEDDDEDGDDKPKCPFGFTSSKKKLKKKVDVLLALEHKMKRKKFQKVVVLSDLVQEMMKTLKKILKMKKK